MNYVTCTHDAPEGCPICRQLIRHRNPTGRLPSVPNLQNIPMKLTPDQKESVRLLRKILRGGA